MLLSSVYLNDKEHKKYNKKLQKILSCIKLDNDYVYFNPINSALSIFITHSSPNRFDHWKKN